MDFKPLVARNEKKIVMLVFDGLGGIPDPSTGLTELETARVPNLDAIAKKSLCGNSLVVDYGITPGSGPGHFALFGYDPEIEIGRGVLEALGVGHRMEKNDLAARGNFATVDANGVLADRRGGFPSSERNREICRRLEEEIELPGCELFAIPGKEHRFVLVIRGEGLSDALSETDPQKTGVIPQPVRSLGKNAKKSEKIVNSFIAQAEKILKDYRPQNMLLLRGFAKSPDIGPFPGRYGLRSCAIAVYPMYKGIAKLVGMDVAECGATFPEQIDALERNYNGYDFFFIHVKETDSAGHAGDFARKSRVLEECDGSLPRLLALKPDCLIITGDHSTPSLLREHSFHPVPVSFLTENACPDSVERFTERAFMSGGLGIFPARKIMQLALAFTLKLKKFGA
ncbi:MAG: 2,3-bisphosphoglycerate-independent phosphoglycerate mutase [Deltaproteobacteria bacterium]|nr:2,3-bisphosphoglycerate-independent phosphoglycerate mutase [Deltaproteobacteria bacterium]